VSDLSTTQIELFIGRSLAFCAHPLVAWRVLPRSRRMLIVAAYFAAAFVTTLSALMLLAV
jgi:hypothetical protein